MARVGRPAKPTALKIAQGNPGKRPLNTQEPVPPAGIPTCPAYLSDEAKREWNRKAPDLVAMGLLSLIDDGTLGAWCEAISDLAEANKALKAHFKAAKCYDITTDKGNLITHPAAYRKASAIAAIGRLSGKFGFSPSDRVGIKVEKQDRDEMSEFISRKTG